eukprot:6207052-Pleurochrysis_carterae.AAC.1
MSCMLSARLEHKAKYLFLQEHSLAARRDACAFELLFSFLHRPHRRHVCIQTAAYDALGGTFLNLVRSQGFADLFSLSADETHIITIAGMSAGLVAFVGEPISGSLFACEVLHRYGLEYYEVSAFEHPPASCFKLKWSEQRLRSSIVQSNHNLFRPSELRMGNVEADKKST